MTIVATEAAAVSQAAVAADAVAAALAKAAVADAATASAEGTNPQNCRISRIGQDCKCKILAVDCSDRNSGVAILVQ